MLSGGGLFFCFFLVFFFFFFFGLGGEGGFWAIINENFPLFLPEGPTTSPFIKVILS